MNDQLNIILVEGRESAIDTIMLKSNFVFNPSDLNNPKTVKSNYIEYAYINCNNRNLDNKWFWNKPLDTFLCFNKQIGDSSTIFRPGYLPIDWYYNKSCYSKNKIYDKRYQLILEIRTCHPGEYKILATPGLNLSTITKYNYTKDNKLESEISYILFRPIRTFSIAPPCPNSEQLFFNQLDNSFLIKQEERRYYYGTNGLVEQEVYNRQLYDTPTYQNCCSPCIANDTSNNLVETKTYSYTYHPK